MRYTYKWLLRVSTHTCFLSHEPFYLFALQVDAASENFNGLAIATLTVFGYSFLVASFVLFLVKEKETKVGRCLAPRHSADLCMHKHFDPWSQMACMQVHR